MSEPKPVWKLKAQIDSGPLYESLSEKLYPPGGGVKLQPFPEPPDSFTTAQVQKKFLSNIAVALAVPYELLRPHVGAIEAAESRQVSMAKIVRMQAELANALPLIRIFDASAAEIRCFAESYEQIRMRMIGRRYQVILAVLLLVVYLIVWMVTK
jgi:hypothetical protein